MKKNKPILKWNDPDPIEGNDYRITSIKYLSNDIALIKYNGGRSEAEVYVDEIEEIKKH